MRFLSGRYEPLIKLKKFDPRPIWRYGIPDFADSIHNPKCVGTVAHEDFWNEQIDRCTNGYLTGGLLIPGRYYYYLNFNQLLTVGRGYHLPEFVDLDYDFFDLVDYVKGTGKYVSDPTAGGKGIIMPKRRRCGVSHKMSQGVFSHGVRFNPGGYKAGIVAGVSDYADGFFAKFKENESRIPPELQLKAMSDDSKWTACYDVRSSHENFIKDGSFNTVFCRTAFANENVFKGEVLNDCDFEEGGEFKHLMKCFSSTSACFMAGMEMVGTPFVQATGGKTNSSAKDFKAMLEDAEKLGLIQFNILGPRMQIGFYIGSVNAKTKKIAEDCPNIVKMQQELGLSREQVLGCEDVAQTEKFIVERKEFLKTANNKEKYYEFLQDNPLTIADVFLNFSANPFDSEILSDRLYELSIKERPDYHKVLLNWKVDKDGVELQPRQVEWKIAPDEMPWDKCDGLMHKHYLPQPGIKDGDVAGCDSYDLDQSNTTKSQGGFAVMRRRDRDGVIIKMPIFIIRQRPKRREIFYDNCLKACVLYNLKYNCLVDVANSAIITHFENNQGAKYLAPRPKEFAAKNSEQDHKYGNKMTAQNKPQLLSLMQAWVNDYASECDFPELLSEINNYNVDDFDSDWDLADAWMLALLRDVDLKKAPRDESKEADRAKQFQLPEWKMIGGVLVDVSGESFQEYKEHKGFENLSNRR